MRRLNRITAYGRERGQALVLFAAGLGAFCGLVGMAIDVGQIVHARTDLQKMADAGAFAGSQELPVPGQAISVAQQYVRANGDSRCTEGCYEVTSTKETNDTLTVRTSRRVNYTFLRVLGMSGTDVTAKAKITSRWATGYRFDHQDVFPYAVWGGNGGGPGGSCPYGLCDGTEVTYRANDYAAANVEPNPKKNPNWSVGSNKFKGYFNHMDQVYSISTTQWQTFSYGGNAQGEDGGAERLQELHEHYLSGQPIILPVIEAARDCGGSGTASCTAPGGGNVEGVQFKIVAWVAVRLTNDPLYTDPAFGWTGEVVAHYSSPLGESGGEPPPPAISPRVTRLIE